MSLHKISRRDFISLSGSAALSVAVGSPLLSCNNSSPTAVTHKTYTFDISQSAYSALQTVGGAAYLQLDNPNTPAIAVRAASNTVNAFSSKCTHQGCQVDLPQSNGKASCPCHGSVFDNTGKVVSGPASADLLKYTASLSGNVLTVST